MQQISVSNHRDDLLVPARSLYDADISSYHLALREHLLAQVHSSHPSLKVENLQTSNSASPHDQNIDPAIAGTGMMSTSAGESGGDDNGSDGKKGGKRELSTSKRAAQNRAAQVRGASLICFPDVVNGEIAWSLFREITTLVLYTAY